jgi:hypothetical protein
MAETTILMLINAKSGVISQRQLLMLINGKRTKISDPVDINLSTVS